MISHVKLFVILGVALAAHTASAQGLKGAIYTTVKDGTVVNQNIYDASSDVYLNGGPQNLNAAGLPDGTYYFQVTDPNGGTLLSTDAAVCRQLSVTGGRVSGAAGPPCKHPIGTFNPANGVTPVKLAPFSSTPNPGGVYKAWLIAQGKTTSISSSDPRVINFTNPNSKTDNFKVRGANVVPSGSCQPSSSLSALVTGTNVVSYVPKGSWSGGTTGVSVVNIEGSSITPTLIPTTTIANSCASNPLTGQTVCTSNNTDVYVLSGTAITNTLTSGGSGFISFSGGACTTCGVAMDATHNKAVIALSIGGTGGFQYLNLGTTPTLDPAFASANTLISEDILIDPIRNLLLSPSEDGNYEIIDVTTTTAPAFYENPTTGGVLDSAGEDCSTGIALAPAEFSGPSNVYIADLTQATFTPGSPGSWTAPAQIQTLADSFLSAGASGIAVAQGTHTGVVTGEFGGNALTAIALPATSGSGTPAITDWVTCSIPAFTMGFDPHTVTAYQSPNGGDAIALLANAGASAVAVVNLTKMLNTTIVPRTGNACTAGTLPATVFSMVSVP